MSASLPEFPPEYPFVIAIINGWTFLAESFDSASV